VGGYNPGFQRPGGGLWMKGDNGWSPLERPVYTLDDVHAYTLVDVNGQHASIVSSSGTRFPIVLGAVVGYLKSGFRLTGPGIPGSQLDLHPRLTVRQGLQREYLAPLLASSA
jgi:hypothetical protein